MILTEIKKILDDEFRIDQIPADMPFSKLMPQIYSDAGIDFSSYVSPEFLNKYHGLMLDNSNNIETVYLGVFFSNEILEKVFSMGAKNALLFFHHPLDLESSNRGFLPIDPVYFELLRKNCLSVYILHTPLDIHSRIATTKSLSNALGLLDAKECCANSVGFSGMQGSLPQKENFEEFTEKLLRLFGVPKLNFVKKFDYVQKIGMIAGGGSDVSRVQEIIQLGCDTYITGDYLNKIDNEFGRMQKQAFLEAMDNLNINLIECSHSATEEVVLRNELSNFFIDLGLPVTVISQRNHWK